MVRRNPLDPGLWTVIFFLIGVFLVAYMAARWRVRNQEYEFEVKRRWVLYIWFGLIVTFDYNTLINNAPLTRSFLIAHSALFTGLTIIVTRLIGKDE